MRTDGAVTFKLVVHLFSSVLAAVLAALWAIGFYERIASWLVWLVGLGAVVALGEALIDRAMVERSARAASLVIVGLILQGALLIGWHANVPSWFLLATSAAALGSLAIGVVALNRQPRDDALQ